MDKKSTPLTDNGVVWDLTSLYQGPDDPALDEELQVTRERAISFSHAHKGRVQLLAVDPDALLSAVREYESILETGIRPYFFGYLFHASHPLDPARTRLLEKLSTGWNEVSRSTAFFELELKALPENLLQKLADLEGLHEYRGFLVRQIQWKPHVLMEAEERLLAVKNQSGRDALLALYDQIIGSLTFSLETRARKEKMTADQALACQWAPDGSRRETALKALLNGLAGYGLVFKAILNAVILDHALENRDRGFASSSERTHLVNGIRDVNVEAVLATVEDHYPLARKYLRLKAQFLGLGPMKNTDIFAPVAMEGIPLSFSQAKGVLLDAMEAVHPMFHSAAVEIFDNSRIDAQPRKGKKPGAFCQCFSPSLHPYISMNYTETLRDWMVLAHEVGHGVHYRLASQQSFLNFRPPPLLAEIASTFSEMALIHHLLKHGGFPDMHRALAAAQMDGILATVFRQSVLNRFEQAVHGQRKDRPLSEEEIGELWWEENHRLFGDDVQMIPEYEWGWAMVPHFFHRPFYCYSYVFGNLLALVMFQKYEEGGREFVEGLIRMLAAGSSQPPVQLLSHMGLDIDSPSLWEGAFHEIGRLVDAVERS
jgi:oligoendopeptidase F